MNTWTLQHVAVWLDESSVSELTFSHALEWAFRLHLPLHVVATTRPNVGDTIKAWQERAATRGIAYEAQLTVEKSPWAIEEFLRPNGLCVFSDTVGAPIMQELLQRSSRIPNTCQLLCASAATPIERVLVFCRDCDLKAEYLESAARICLALETTPLVLILAGSEYDVELKQEYAEGIFHSRRMHVDVDIVIDHDAHRAVKRVVSWRRCSHVIVPRSLHDSDRLLRDLTATMSVLTVPETAALDLPHRIMSVRGVLPWNRSHMIESNTTTETG